MASPIRLLICQLLFFFFLSLNVSCTDGDKQHRRLISVSSLLMNDTECSSSTSFDSAENGENQSRIQVVHRHGPCSPLRQPKPLDHERRVLEHDRRRVESLHGLHQAQSSSRLYPGNSLAATMQGRYGLALGSADFVVTVGFGSPPQAMSVIFDSGSDLSWIQCQPCPHLCYTQKEPLFDPSNSSHYSLLPCDSSYCSSSSTMCDGFGHCGYTVSYGDGSQTSGLLSQDTLTLTSSYVLDDFVFGCGEANSGLFGEVAGIIGLGRDHISLPSQANGGAFSYCLPPYASSTGYLALGTSNGSRPNSPKNLHFTSMPSRSDAPSFYFVELVGISVGGKDLRISPTSFSDPGTFIDSGTVLTYLPADAYAALRSEFRWRMSKYPTSAGVDPLDTCYDMEGYDRVAVPAVVLHFSGGARLDVDSSGILFTLDRSSAIACLAFAEKDPNGFTIIGNMQQKTYNIVYDVPNEKIGFGAGGCTADPF
ncbi:aspartyl protease family protein At5g10770-like [Curcuma longa]|uniref:aspartyl protease family protein At5g10770-like n=1 Tax=Curcuma longa TaxID=136217 RepID=UPI003D9F4B6A